MGAAIPCSCIVKYVVKAMMDVGKSITSYVTQLRQLAGTEAGTGVHQSTLPKPLKEHLPAPSQIRGRVSAPSGEVDGQTTSTTPVAVPG